MTEVRKLLRLNKLTYYETHLSLINCLFVPLNMPSMIPMEIKVLASFMSLELTDALKQYRFSSVARKIVMQELNLSPSGISNYIRDLKLKGFLIQKEGTITIFPILNPDDTEQTYLFKLINISNTNTNVPNN